MELLSKEKLQEKLLTDRDTLAKALVALHAHQTEDERKTLTTKYLNRVGVRPCHARIVGSMVNYYMKNNNLTDAQFNFWTLDNWGKPRILIYLNQLYKIHARKYQNVLKEKKNETSKV